MRTLLALFLIASTAFAANSYQDISGGIPFVAPGVNGNVLTSNGTNWISAAASGGSVSWGSITGTLSSQSDLQTALNGKEPSITAGTTLQYFRGDKTFQTLNTSVVPESGNLYYTDARVQTLAKNQISQQEFWVSKDVGNDANDGSRLKPFKTIGAAITAGNAIAAYYKQVIIHIAPINNGGSAGGNYNENITLSQQGVNLVCDNAGSNSRPCQIGGTLTVNLTGVSGGTNFIAASNEVYIYGLVFTSGASDTVTFSGTTYQRLIASNCYFQAAAARAAVVTNTGTSSGTPSAFISYDTVFENNSASIETARLTSGRFWFYGTTGMVMNDNAAGPSVIQDGTSSLIANLVQFTGQYQQTSNTSTATFNLSTITSGTASCISTPSSPSTGYALLAYFGCNSSNTNSVTGSGVLVGFPGNARLGTSGDIVSTVTQVVEPGLPQGEILVGAGAVTGTNVMISYKDGHIKNSQTTAPTTTVQAAAGTGASCTVSHATDSTGTVQITFGSASFSTGAQCNINFNKAYGVAPICTISPANASAANDMGSNHQIYITSTTSVAAINYGVAQNSAGAVNQWNYRCMETQ